MEFPFAFDRAARLVLAPLGVWPSTARVRVTDGRLEVDFGPWRLRTVTANVVDATVSGPYMWVKVVGPHLSLADRGVTFGTNAVAGVCVRFVEPVPALLPGYLPGPTLRHPGATITVADPEHLATYLTDRITS